MLFMEVLDKLEASIDAMLTKHATLRAEIDRLKQSNDSLVALERENESLRNELELEKRNTKEALERVENILTRLKEQTDTE